MRHLTAVASILCAVPSASALGAVPLLPETIQAFDEYAESAGRQFSQRLNGEVPFLWSSEDPARARALSEGMVVAEPVGEKPSLEIPGGLVHDWIAAVLVPDAPVEQVVGTVTAYDTHAETYGSSILQSEILERDGPKLRVAMRMLKDAGVRVVFDTEHAAVYERLDERRWWGRSRSVSIREVVHPGTAKEFLKPAGDDNGYLWRLHTFWRFAATEEGVVAEYRTLTLTRSIPAALRWVLRPILSRMPRQSLRNVMRTTRDAALAKGP